MNEMQRIENEFSNPLYWDKSYDLNTKTHASYIHQSIFRDSHILKLVLRMVERGDSKETILGLADFYSKYEAYVPVERVSDSKENK